MEHNPQSAGNGPVVAVVGAGLAGSEAALQLASQGIAVRLYDTKPQRRSPAHHAPQFAEIVCSNSLGSQGPSASGLLKEELAQYGCHLLAIAQSVAVPAGQALAVDRDAFAQAVTERLQAEPLIELCCEEVTTLPLVGGADGVDGVAAVILATGPLTTEPLAQTLATLCQRQSLYFFDAAAPIVMKDSINFDVAFVQDRYGHRQGKGADVAAEQAAEQQAQGLEETPEGSYINCPLNQAQYEALVAFMLAAEKTPLKAFEAEAAEKTTFFESCMPIEVMASRGKETLRFGPLKPVGLVNPHAPEERPYAVVQLRQDNAEGTLYNLVGFQTNLKWGPQKELIHMIPGLEAAEVIRYGVMHRNTYVHSPDVLEPTLRFKQHPHVFLAGQLTGTEGYTESIATGLLAATNVGRLVQGQPLVVPPKETMLGALVHYITREEAVGKAFQPINSNWGIVPPLAGRVKDKRQRAEAYRARALEALAAFRASW
jgi:methylenetetrahydrofolate--tRNA-(uracil-5-)-methyltransferase